MSHTAQATVAERSSPATVHADPGRFQAGRVFTISFGHALHDTYTAFLSPLLPTFIANLALSKTEAGLLSLFMQAPSLLQPFIGHLGDRVNLRYLVFAAPALTAVMMSLLGVAPNYATLVLLLVVTGFSSAGLHAVGPVIAGRLSGRRLGQGMSFWMVGGELGRTVGPMVIVAAVRLLTLQGTPWLMLGGLLGSAILYIRLRDVPGRPSTVDAQPAWGQALRSMGPLLLPLTGIIIVRAFMVMALTTYLPVFLSEEGANLWFVGASLTVLQSAGVAGAMLAGPLSDRISRRTLLAVSLLVAPLLMLAFLQARGWVQIPLLLLLGFAAISVNPVFMALVQESFPQNRALANGIYMALNFVLSSAVVVILGTLGDRFGLRPAFTASAFISLLGLPLIFLLPVRRTHPA